MDLNQVCIPATDLSVSVPFYQALGFELIVHTRPEYARFLCPKGQATFSLHQVNEVAKGHVPTLYFECHQLEEQVSQLKRKGLTFLWGPRMQKWLWNEACLLDPDGHEIILYHAGNNRINPSWRLKN